MAYYLAATLLATAGLLFGISSPASAAPNCASGVSCAFENIDFGGNVFTAVYSQRGVCHNFSSTMNNRASSLSNSSSRRTVYYKDSNCGGAWIAVAAGYAKDDLRLYGFNDNISSVRMDLCPC